MSVAARPLVPGAGPRPVTTREDVLAQLPAEIRLSTAAPIRDRLADALGSMIAEYELRAETSAALSDLLRSARTYLSVLGEDQGSPRQPDEEDDDYRERALIPDGVVTEAAIIAGVNAILSLVTDKRCRLVDATLDQWFVRKAAPVFLGMGAYVSAIGAGAIAVPLFDAPAGTLHIVQLVQNPGGTGAGIADASAPAGWELRATNSFPNGARHSVYVHTSVNGDSLPTFTLTNMGATGVAQARSYAYHASLDGTITRDGESGSIIPAPPIDTNAIMLAFIAYNSSTGLSAGFGGWSTVSANVTSTYSMYAQTVFGGSSPSNTAAIGPGTVNWSLLGLQLFPGGGKKAWHSFPGSSPRYLTRLYDADAAFNGGVFRPNSTPLGAHVFRLSGPSSDLPLGSRLGRKFLLLLPDLLGRDSNSAYIGPANSQIWKGAAFWVAKASSPTAMRSYIQRQSDTAFAIYRTIEGLVNNLVGQSIRWVAIGVL